MTELPKEMVTQLAKLCFDRYHSALSEGLTEHETFEELVTTILETYREAMVS